MGMGLGDASFDMPTIAEEMRPALYSMFNAHIQIVDPNRTEVSPYDAVTDTGGTSVALVVFDSGPNGASVEPIRSAVNVEFGSQSVSVQGVRLQTKLALSTDKLRAGMVVKVLDGGEAPWLEEFQYALTKPFESGYAWGRILEASVIASR